MFFGGAKRAAAHCSLCKKVYIIALGETRCYQSPTRTCSIYNMPPKRRNLRAKLDAVAAEDLRRKRKAKAIQEDEEYEENVSESESESESEEEEEEDMEAVERPPAGASKTKKKTMKKKKKEERKLKLRSEGSVLERTCAVDKFGFSTVDGNRYLDDTAPQDFPDSSFHFNESKQTELGNQWFSARYALLRGRSKKDGSLYSSPSIFLQKDWQGKYLTFTLPDKHVSALRKFLEEVEREKQSTL